MAPLPTYTYFNSLSLDSEMNWPRRPSNGIICPIFITRLSEELMQPVIHLTHVCHKVFVSAVSQGGEVPAV